MIKLNKEKYKLRWEILDSDDANLLLGFAYGQYFSHSSDDSLSFSVCTSIEDLLSAFYCCGVPKKILEEVTLTYIEKSLSYLYCIDEESIDIQCISLLFKNLNLIIKFNLDNYEVLSTELLKKFEKKILNYEWVELETILLYKAFLSKDTLSIFEIIALAHKRESLDPFFEYFLEVFEDPNSGIKMLINGIEDVLQIADMHYLNNKETHFLNRVIKFKEIGYYFFDPTISMLKFLKISLPNIDAKFFPELEIPWSGS